MTLEFFNKICYCIVLG